MGEEVQVQQSTTNTYFVRSTVLGGKVVAELGETGAKQLGYIFAGSMRIATQYIYLSGSSVGWTSTSPATGSEYMTDQFLARKELDPLGTDVTYAPQPDLISEPIFYNPKFDQMPLEIEGGPSAEYQRANQAWADLMAEAFQAFQDRARAEQLWQSGKRSEAMAILMKNPNVGIEYRAIYKNEVIRHGSYFGQDAADFLYGISIAVNQGLLSSVNGNSASISQNTAPNANAIRDGLRKALSRVDCSAIVNNLLNSVATKKNPRVTQDNLLAMFDSVVSGSGGLTRVAPPGSAGYGSPTGNLKKGDAGIFLKAYSYGPENQLGHDIQTTLGEIMHLGGQNAFFTDRAFAEIVHRDFYNLTTSIWPGDPADTFHKAAMKDPNNISWSYYWHQAVERLCFLPGGEQ